jgi:hypothetical protein
VKASANYRPVLRAASKGFTARRALGLLVGTALALAIPAGATQAADKTAKASPAPPATKAAYKVPRNGDGQPDLGGVWSSASLTTETRPATATALVYTPGEVKKLEDFAQFEIKAGNANTDPNAGVDVPNGLELRPSFAAAGGPAGGYNRGWLDPGNLIMRVNGQPRSSILTTPNGQVPPVKGGAPKVADREYGGEGGGAGNSDNPENRTLGDRCLVFGRGAGPPMLPNGFYNNNYEIVQSKDEIAIMVEMIHDVRHVVLNRKEHLPANLRPWFGDSLGHWEGDTLVVETTNLPEGQAYHGSWKNLKVTERFTRVAKDRLSYQYTVDDPTMWDKPWGGEYEFSPLSGQIYEYACHEGNYAMEGILAGARQIEHDAAAKKAEAGALTRSQ